MCKHFIPHLKTFQVLVLLEPSITFPSPEPERHDVISLLPHILLLLLLLLFRGDGGVCGGGEISCRERGSRLGKACRRLGGVEVGEGERGVART